MTGPTVCTVYMSDPDKALTTIGVVTDDKSIVHRGAMVLVSGIERVGNSLPSITCMICYDDSTMYSALECGHSFCNECYTTFLEHKVCDEGHNCVSARCPEMKVAPMPPAHHRRPAPSPYPFHSHPHHPAPGCSAAPC